jgi:hypothetical protein
LAVYAMRLLWGIDCHHHHTGREYRETLESSTWPLLQIITPTKPRLARMNK